MEDNTARDKGTETPVESTEHVIDAGEQVYTCECCGHEATAEDGLVTEDHNGRTKVVDATMWAAAGELGKEHVLRVFCKKCAMEGKEDGQVFFPLKNALAFAERVQRHYPKRERLLEMQREPEMREVRPEMVCKGCGKSHGQIDNYRGDVTLIRKALRIDFHRKPITAEFLCGDCLKRLGLVPKDDGKGNITQPQGLFPPWKTLVMAKEAEADRLERNARNEEARQRRLAQRKRDDEIRQQALASKPANGKKIIYRPAGKPGTGSMRNHADRKDGTHNKP